MPKKTLLSVLAVAVAIALVLPMLSCDEENQNLDDQVLFTMTRRDTVTVAKGTYWARQFPEVKSSMFGHTDRVSLDMEMDCVGTLPDSNPKWYILNSDQYVDFGLGHPNQQFMNAQLGGSGCSMWVYLYSNQTGTYWAIVDNRRETQHDIRVTGSIVVSYYGHK
jgi:hypothetical protein